MLPALTYRVSKSHHLKFDVGGHRVDQSQSSLCLQLIAGGMLGFFLLDVSALTGSSEVRYPVLRVPEQDNTSGLNILLSNEQPI